MRKYDWNMAVGLFRYCVSLMSQIQCGIDTSPSARGCREWENILYLYIYIIYIYIYCG